MAPPAPKELKAVRVGSAEQALSRLQVFGRALSVAEVAQLHDLWKNEWQTPTPNPAAFDQKPVALTPTLVVMAAQAGQSEAGGIEYRFTKISGAPRASDGAWIPVPWFLDDGLQPDMMYDYSVQVRDALGNVTAGSPRASVGTGTFQLQEFQDSWTIARDFLTQGVADSIWSGFLSGDDGSAPAVIAVRDGALRLQSKGTVWDGGKPLGPFLFRLVAGDFVAQVTVADYQGLAARRVPGNNDGGLMVRVPLEKDAGPGEDLVQLNFFPIWNQGNMVTVMDGGRIQKGNLLAWDAHRHLQIIRHGLRFYFRTSADGVRWQDMPGSPVERKDMAGLPLQVGLYHASYGAESSFVSFRDFRLTTRK
jgi:hypothetical protein